jgi:hypothetical protein
VDTFAPDLDSKPAPAPKEEEKSNKKVPYIRSYGINSGEDRNQAVGESGYSNKSVSQDKSENTTNEDAKRTGKEDYTKKTSNFSDAQLIMKMINQKIPNLRHQF